MAARKAKRAAKPAPRPTMPLVIYVVRGAEDTYFGHDTFGRFEHGDKVGVYELREVRTLNVTRGLR